MLSMNSLGSNGRLGNQMFQYASLKGIAKNNGYDFCIPKSLEKNPYYDHMLFKFFKMNDVITGTGFGWQKQESNGFRFDSNLFYNCPDNVDIIGYLQSYKYFDHIQNDIKKDFTFKNKYEKIEYDVSIHVRRGDYVQKTEYHGLMSNEYYENAMSFFSKNTKFIVFSDDIEWCKKQLIFSKCLFYNGFDEGDDMSLMSNAKLGNIIANSSFSWWGAWLNQNKDIKIIAPKYWFNENYISVEDTSDLIPMDWIRI